MRMAHGDASGLRDLAFEYFNDTRRLMAMWLPMIDARDFGALRTELHRSKGGASLFGLERLLAILDESEKPMMLERNGFDLTLFEQELAAAECAVLEMTEID